MKDATAAAEHLKQIVQDVLSAFQSGAGICDGRPEPMTFELAVHTLWRAIDEAFSESRPKGQVRLRLSKKSGTLAELLGLLTVSGTWTVRASSRGENTVAHVVGVLNRRAKLDSDLLFFAEHGWTVTDLALSA